jgi:hypothetical protein
MDETGERQSYDFTKMPLIWPLLICAVMFAGAVWGGGEIARGEIAQQDLDSITAKGHLVKAKRFVPPGVVVTAEMVQEVEAYANRVEPYCLNRAAAAIGKKTKFGLEAGQVLVVKDLE